MNSLPPPKPLSIQTENDPTNPGGITISVAFDDRKLLEFARLNPDASFLVEGCPSPISMALYWEARQKSPQGNIQTENSLCRNRD
jgi:hypothetical protein